MGVAGAIPRSIPLRVPRLAALVKIALREGGTGSTPFPMEPVIAGDVVIVCSGVDRHVDSSPEAPLRVTLAAFDVERGEERYVLQSPSHDQVGLPGIAPDGRIAQLLRRNDVVSLLIADPKGDGGVVEIEPTVPRLLRAEEAVLSQPLAGPGGSWIVSWGLRNPDPRRLRTHRVECLREGGPPLWWADDERVLGACEGIVVTRAVSEALVGHLAGRRIGTGAPVWDTSTTPGSRIELFGDLLLVLDRSRRARERSQRYDAFVRSRMERIANDPIGSRAIDWEAESARLFREGGRLAAAPVRGVDALTGAIRFRVDVAGDPIGVPAGGPHVVAMVVVDEEGVGGIVRRRAADGVELGRRGFHVENVFHAVPPLSLDAFPEIVGLDHTHLLWLDSHKELVCEVLADPGREVWRLPMPPLTGPAAFAVSAGRIFVRDAESLRIFSEES